MKKHLNSLIFFGLCTIFLTGAVSLQAMEQPRITLDVGCCSCKAKKEYHEINEDRFLCVHNGKKTFSTSKMECQKPQKTIEKLTEPQKFSLFAVFDGHSSCAVSDALALAFDDMLNKYYTKNEPKEIKNALEKTIEIIEKDLLILLNENKERSGSTLTGVLLIEEDELNKGQWLLFNVGDSRTVIYNQETDTIYATKDHSLKTNQEEYDRVKNAGGFIHKQWFRNGETIVQTTSKFDTESTWGILNKSKFLVKKPTEFCEAKTDGLAPYAVHISVSNQSDSMLGMSRSIGDLDYKIGKDKDKNAFNYKIITAQPEFSSCPAAPGDIVIVASDGFWDVIKNEEAIEMVKKLRLGGSNSSQISKYLCNWARQKGSIDDITVIVVTAN